MTASKPSRTFNASNTDIASSSKQQANKSSGFSFKQFHVNHDQCAMKVGTDGILLGAWAPLAQSQKILDIGTGTGLIALMLAQRSKDIGSDIDAIDIEERAIAQARQNIADSPWPSRVHCFAQSLQTFANEAGRQQSYDLIVSNPPYFNSGQVLDCQARQTARLTGELDHVSLCKAALRLLKPQGSLCLVLPYQAALALLQHLEQALAVISQQTSQHKVMSTPPMAWQLLNQVDVYTKSPAGNQSQAVPHRCLLELQKIPAKEAMKSNIAQATELYIHEHKGGYSSSYIALTRDFYLKM